MMFSKLNLSIELCTAKMYYIEKLNFVLVLEFDTSGN